jgi:hypothetical protein
MADIALVCSEVLLSIRKGKRILYIALEWLYIRESLIDFALMQNTTPIYSFIVQRPLYVAYAIA